MPAAPAATPLARRVAAAHHIDLGAVSGSGRDGRITRADVEARVAAPEPDSGGEIARFTTVRAVTARRMAEGAEVPQVTLFTEADATELVAARRQINDLLDEAKVSYNALLVAICGRALAEMPDLNASLAPDGLRLHAAVNIGVAVDTERGLLVPVVRDVPSLPLSAINAALAALVARALAGKSRPEDLEGGTFTITNLGMYDVDAFTPIVTPPQVAILGVGRIAPQVVPHEGQIAIRERVALSLSFDHRAVDGGPAARFLKRIKDLVERPYGLLMAGNRQTGA
jgi:pyruvate dehydrogenase E2 component (dihydrolipoamide acetyltransferase)